MNVRLLTEKDYETIVKWWKWWRWPVLPQSMLPDGGKGGYMIEKNGTPIICGFVYLTNSKIAWLE